MFFFSSPVKSEKVDLGIPFLYSSIQMKEKKKKAEFVDWNGRSSIHTFGNNLEK